MVGVGAWDRWHRRRPAGAKCRFASSTRSGEHRDRQRHPRRQDQTAGAAARTGPPVEPGAARHGQGQEKTVGSGAPGGMTTPVNHCTRNSGALDADVGLARRRHGLAVVAATTRASRARSQRSPASPGSRRRRRSCPGLAPPGGGGLLDRVGRRDRVLQRLDDHCADMPADVLIA
jgi:hypothetical protein